MKNHKKVRTNMQVFKYYKKNINGSIRKINRTNSTYVEPHKIIIRCKTTRNPRNFEAVVEPIVSKELWENCQVQNKKNDGLSL